MTNGVIFMAARMTWEEIKKTYHKQFVYLDDVEWVNASTVKSASVIHATENQDDNAYVEKAMRGELVEKYTAPGTTLLAGAR